MKAVILCGGKGTRLQEATGGIQPKPMVEVGGRPILWHIMKLYAHFGIKEFVLCLGHLGKQIKDYFLHYEPMNNDFTLRLGRSDSIRYHNTHPETDWTVTLADTGEDTMTGARLALVRKYVGDETFMFTYGDGVADIDLNKLLEFHRAHGKVATVTGVRPSGRFGRLNIDGELVVDFEEKPVGENGYINGGFLVLEPKIFDYVSEDPGCIFERAPMENLVKDRQLMVFRHEGFWQCMDTYRDLLLLQEAWQAGAPWRLWED